MDSPAAAPPAATWCPPGSEDGRSRLARVRPRSWHTGVVVLAALLAVTLALARSVMFVDGSSMLPSLYPGQLLLLNRLAYRGWDGGGPRRGDLIVFRRQTADPDDFVVKRVIGIPGDLVQIDTGKVVLNGETLDEPYVLATDDYTYPIAGAAAKVPDGSYFVLGDNRPLSADSHLGWFVPAKDVIGEALALPIAVPVHAGRSTT